MGLIADAKFRSRFGVSRSRLRRTLFDLSSELQASDDPLAKSIATGLLLSWDELRTGKELPADSALSYVGVATNDPAWLTLQSANPRAENIAFKIAWPESATRWGRAFVRELLGELRSVICDNNSQYSSLTKELGSAKAFVVVVAPILVSRLGIADPAASGLAGLIMLCLLNASRNTFCKMTDQQVIEALDKGPA